MLEVRVVVEGDGLFLRMKDINEPGRERRVGEEKPCGYDVSPTRLFGSWFDG